MHTFKDNEGRMWEIQLDIPTFKAIKDATKIDLLNVLKDEGKALFELEDDVVSLVNVIYVCCRQQADKIPLSDEDFGRAMRGDVLGQATQALMEELVDFFPGRRRTLLKKALGKMDQLQAALLNKASRDLEAIDLDQVLNGRTTSGDGSTSSADTLVSTPTSGE